MKLYSVTARWHVKGYRKDMIQTTLVMAESREAAREKFDANLHYPEGTSISILEWEDGIYTTNARKMI